MNTQKKGSFSRWSGNSAEWYEAASKYTRYHEKLKTHIAPYLNPKETCCELACGAGTLARHLAPLTARYIANDIDPSSLEFCSRLQNQEPVANLEFLPGDWRKVLAGKKFDTVIFSYFSAIFTDWDALRQLAEKKSSPSSRVTALTRSKRKRKLSPREAVLGGLRKKTLRRRPPACQKPGTAHTQISRTRRRKRFPIRREIQKRIKKQTEKKAAPSRLWRPSPNF